LLEADELKQVVEEHGCRGTRAQEQSKKVGQRVKRCNTRAVFPPPPQRLTRVVRV
jgi:hypothetical protein